MSEAALNLTVFFAIIVSIIVIVKLSKSGRLWHSKKRKQKTITEDILKQLFHVAQSKRTATISDLSGALKIRRRMILSIVLEMTQNGLLSSENDLVILTKEGRDYALKIIRTHRLWEKYLAEKTGHKAADWHHLAEKMEHQLTEREIDKLSAQLGNPMFDPHGDPIPTQEGNITIMEWIPLPAYGIKTPGKIAHIEDEPDVIYKHILKSRIFVGSHFEIITSTNKEIVFISEGKEHRFSPIIAANISVTSLDTQEKYKENTERLSVLKKGELAYVTSISKECRGVNRRRLLDLGILPGTAIEIELESPLGDPIAYKIRNTSIALRNSLADLILISKTEI